MALAAIFLPGWGDEFAIDEISPRDAIVQIAPYSYGPAPRTKYPEETAKYFTNAADRVSAVPCFSLTRPYDLGQLNELVPLVSNHLGNTGRNTGT